MKNSTSRFPLRHSLLLALALGLASLLPGAQAAGFFEDAKGTLTFRNFFINRDFKRDNATRSKAEEWTQNFILD
ncbi:outer membrane porin, OprD family, partial [Azotobacter beijerinckii]